MSIRIRHVIRLQRRFVPDHSASKTYGLASTSALAALSVRLALDPILGEQSPYLPFTIAVIVAARFGGRGPGFASTALSALGVLFFLLEPRFSFRVASHEAAAGLALFVVVGSLISLLVGQLSESLLTTALSEKTVRQLSEQRGLALEAGNLGAWDYRLDTEEFLGDERWRNLYGVPTGGGQLEYNAVVARIHAGDREATRAAVRQALAGANDGAYHQEYRVVWPDNSIHWVASYGQAFFEGQGEDRRAARIAGVDRDVTERRRAEERLQQTQKLESVGLLASGVAHDFNNLLTVIMGSASSAIAQCPSCELSHMTLSASKRAAHLTKQLLAFAGKGHAVVEIIDLTELVGRSTALLSASVPRRVNLRFNLSEGLPCLEGDPSRIEQILMNLVINAGEAIPTARDGLIEITSGRCEVSPDLARRHSKAYDVAAGLYVYLEVRDNGAGIDEATSSHMFEPFFSTKFTGRGLGLAAVDGIVRTSKGFIDVHSSHDAGTTFRVFLPASEKRRPTESAQNTSCQQIRGTSTVLLVDDNEMVRKLASTALRREGYEVLEAKDGKGALHLLAGSPSPPSLVLLELAVSAIGETELVPVLRQKYPDLKIVISSGYPEAEARNGFPYGSVAGFLQKPYTVGSLAEKIGQALLDGPTQSGGLIEFPRTG